MRVRHSATVLLLLVTWTALVSGCSPTSIAKQAYYEIRGAKSKIILTEEIGDDVLLAYRGFRFESVTSSVGDRICPPSLRREYDSYARDLMIQLREFYPGGDPSLIISSDLLYFQRKGLLSGAECLARVTMRDAGDERVVVDAVVHTESKSFRAGGESALAESNVKAIGKFLKKRKLEEVEEGEEEENQEHGD